MALYRLRRPAPIQIFATHAKRQAAGLGAVGPGSEGEREKPEGPESPDSPGSSPSTVGASSPGENSDSDDDEPSSPKQSSSSSASQVSSTSAATTAPPPLPSSTTAQLSTTSSPPGQTSSKAVAPPSSSSSSRTLSRIATSTSASTFSSPFTIAPSTQGIAAVAPLPLPTDQMRTTVVTSTRPISTGLLASPDSPDSPDSPKSPKYTISSTSTLTSTLLSVLPSKITRSTSSVSATVSGLPPPPTNVTEVPVGDNDPPRRTRPQSTIMSKGAEAAAITLSIIGAIALAFGILLYCKRRRRRQNEKLEAELERDAANHAALQHSETSHISTKHMTQTSDRSNTLFGPGTYSRPETVSTRDGSRIPMPQPTPNPFADPPLNKAYDVLAGRPRSTTLTDRGSWIKNPFKDPESERFDPFGELQAKARRERVKQVELAKREAELESQFREKEKMGLGPPERVVDRKGSGVTLEGLGVLDRSGGGAYR